MDNISNHFPLNLQFFAEPGGTGSDDGGETGDKNTNSGSGDGPDKNGDQNTEKADPPKTPSFSEMLKTDKAFQSEFDKRVAGAIAAAKGKWDEEAKLSADDLAKRKQAEAEEALKNREAAIAARELKADMMTELGKKGLPTELIDAISLTDKDAAVASLGNVEKVFRAAVEAEVTKRMAGDPPPSGSGGNSGSAFADRVRAAAGIKTK